MSTTHVRPATAADLPVMRELLGQLGYALDAATMEQRYAAFVAAGEQVLVAERDGQVIGLATLHQTPALHRAGAVGRVTALVVRDSARGTGAGAALMREAEARLTAAGCVLIEVTSNRRRLDAHAFYERLGYEGSGIKFTRPLPP